MKHYFKLNNDIIVDAIQYPVEGYVEVELTETHLPAGINGGWYRWDGEQPVFDEELYAQLNPVDETVLRLNALEAALGMLAADIVMGGQ